MALLDGEVPIDQFSEKRINSDDVWHLIDRTKTHHEEAYDRPVVVAHPLGTGDHALGNTEIVNKYRSLTNSVIPGGPSGRHREDRPQPRVPRRHLRADGPAHTHRTVRPRLTDREGRESYELDHDRDDAPPNDREVA